MASEGMQFSWRWNGGTISLNLGVIWEMSVDAVQQRLDEHPEKMRQRRETVEHPFGTIKSWMGSTHFQTNIEPNIELDCSAI